MFAFPTVHLCAGVVCPHDFLIITTAVSNKTG